MVYLTLLSVGNLKEVYFLQAMEEYKKRLSPYAKVEEIQLKEEKIRDESDPAAIREALEREGKAILSHIPKDAYTVVLAVEGDMPDSPALAKKLEAAARKSGKICFVIGSSHGLSPEVKAAGDYLLSVSRLTFPHQLLRVMLTEILYRSYTILAGKTYHK